MEQNVAASAAVFVPLQFYTRSVSYDHREPLGEKKEVTQPHTLQCRARAGMPCAREVRVCLKTFSKGFMPVGVARSKSRDKTSSRAVRVPGGVPPGCGNTHTFTPPRTGVSRQCRA